MRKSVLLRKIILLVLAAVVLSGFLVAGIYTVVAQGIFSNQRAKELLPIARRVADMIAGDEEQKIFERGNSDFLSSQLHIYDAEGNSMMPDRQTMDKPFPGGGLTQPNEQQSEVMPEKPPNIDDFDDTEEVAGTVKDEILAGAEVSKVIRSSNSDEPYIVVGVPGYGEDGSVVGAVVFTKRLNEMDDTQFALLITLLLSTLMASLIMLIPSYFATKRITGPIRNMQEVSLAMAKGDFSQRADENQRGELGELAHSINLFAEETEKLEQTRRDYVANVSHELRTPLASMRALSETLKDGLITDPQKKQAYYENMVRETIRLSRLVNDMLELSRLQSGGIAVEKCVFRLSETLEYLIDTYQIRAEETGLRFHADESVSALPPLFSNPDRIEQILVILLDNAIRHTPEGGTITLGAERTGEIAEITVSDTGEGISEEDAAHIFERFYKADKSHSSGGNGLGLSIAWEVIRRLGETISVKSKIGEGTSFTFTVHLA